MVDSRCKYRDVVEGNWSRKIDLARYMCLGVPHRRRCGHGNPVFGLSSLKEGIG